jgi:hypothetical protein
MHAALVHWAHVLHFSLDPLHLRCHRSGHSARPPAREGGEEAPPKGETAR